MKLENKIHKRLRNALKPFKMSNLKSVLKNKVVTLFLAVLGGFLVFRMISMCANKEGFESKPSTFNQDVSNGKKLVWFYADWCGHCKKMEKEWDTASKNVDGKMIKINLGDNENKQQQEISKKYNIQGFPTILLLDNGEKKETYSGERTSSAFENFCNKHIN